MKAAIEHACTVILLRDAKPSEAGGTEVLMLERTASMSAFAGAWVFPGGKVDPADYLTSDAGSLVPAEAALVAGVREVKEETGLELVADQLVPFSQWCPMQNLRRRFLTWFVLGRAPEGEISINLAEHQQFKWVRPNEALLEHAAGSLTLAPPTWLTLKQLADFGSVESALRSSSERRAPEFKSHLLPESADAALDAVASHIIWSGDEEYPEVDGLRGAKGSRHRLSVSQLPWHYQNTQGENG